MAKVIDKMPKPPKGTGSSRWIKFLDGQVWEIELGVDVSATHHVNGRTAFYAACKVAGLRGTYQQITATTAAVQALPKEPT